MALRLVIDARNGLVRVLSVGSVSLALRSLPLAAFSGPLGHEIPACWREPPPAAGAPEVMRAAGHGGAARCRALRALHGGQFARLAKAGQAAAFGAGQGHGSAVAASGTASGRAGSWGQDGQQGPGTARACQRLAGHITPQRSAVAPAGVSLVPTGAAAFGHLDRVPDVLAAHPWSGSAWRHGHAVAVAVFAGSIPARAGVPGPTAEHEAKHGAHGEPADGIGNHGCTSRSRGCTHESPWPPTNWSYRPRISMARFSCVLSPVSPPTWVWLPSPVISVAVP